MNEEELKTMDKNELLGVIKAQRYEIERLNNIIKEIKQEMENAKNIKVEDEYHIMEHTKKLLEILDKENK